MPGCLVWLVRRVTLRLGLAFCFTLTCVCFGIAWFLWLFSCIDNAVVGMLFIIVGILVIGLTFWLRLFVICCLLAFVLGFLGCVALIVLYASLCDFCYVGFGWLWLLSLCFCLMFVVYGFVCCLFLLLIWVWLYWFSWLCCCFGYCFGFECGCLFWVFDLGCCFARLRCVLIVLLFWTY